MNISNVLIYKFIAIINGQNVSIEKNFPDKNGFRLLSDGNKMGTAA
jgi:hypothetical protein